MLYFQKWRARTGCLVPGLPIRDLENEPRTSSRADVMTFLGSNTCSELPSARNERLLSGCGRTSMLEYATSYLRLCSTLPP
jgi:hypothetical protein